MKKLADAVCKHETANGTKGYGLPPYNNCAGIKYGSIVRCKTGANRMCKFKNIEEGKQAFIKIWTYGYGGRLPNLAMAQRYSNDRVVSWLKNVLFFYNN